MQENPSNTPVLPGGTMPLPTSGMAIASLVTGILGWILLPIVGSIVAIVLGNAARKETRAKPPRADGDGLARAGIILGWVQLGLLVLGVCIIAVLMMLGPIIGNTFSTINTGLAQ